MRRWARRSREMSARPLQTIALVRGTQEIVPPWAACWRIRTVWVPAGLCSSGLQAVLV